jgi:hypothetical protein
MTYQNLMQEEIKRRLNAEPFSSSLVSEKLQIRILRIIILPVVLYGCATWSLTLREEPSLRVFDTNVLRRIFGLRRDDVTGGCRKLHSEETP